MTIHGQVMLLIVNGWLVLQMTHGDGCRCAHIHRGLDELVMMLMVLHATSVEIRAIVALGHHVVVDVVHVLRRWL